MQESDDNKTVNPRAGAAQDGPVGLGSHPLDENNALPVGSRVAEFEIRNVIGIGGFGIVYLAHDHSLGRDVALKEYLPTSLAFRNGGSVSVRAPRDADTFAAGLASFINEARVLAQFNHPSLVNVYRFWSANGTAYMVMPFYEGPTLKQALSQAAQAPTEAWLKELLAPMLSALHLLHSENYFHRDIAPDNILLVKGKRPLLLDFGAARRVIAGSDKALTVILKPGFAPIEQYSDGAEMAQGAWTDIYALAAVMHYAITGKPPVASVNRLIKDTSTPLAQAFAGKYSDRFLRALDHALAVLPQARPQSLAEFDDRLGIGQSVAVEPPVETGHLPKPKPTPNVNRRRLAIASVVGVGLAGAVAVLVLRAPGSTITEAAEKPPVKVATGSPGVAAPAATAAPRMPEPPASPVPAPVEVTRAFQPADALAQLYDLRDPGHTVVVSSQDAIVRIGRDKLKFTVQSDRPGYLYIFMVGTDRQHISLLFPNALDAKNQIAAGTPVSLPRPGWAMTAAGPPGTNDMIVMVSERPRNFRDIELSKLGPFWVASLSRVETLVRTGSGTAAALAGVPQCAAEPCATRYGAARFLIEEVDR